MCVSNNISIIIVKTVYKYFSIYLSIYEYYGKGYQKLLALRRKFRDMIVFVLAKNESEFWLAILNIANWTCYVKILKCQHRMPSRYMLTNIGNCMYEKKLSAKTIFFRHSSNRFNFLAFVAWININIYLYIFLLDH